jgi:hypothetical protein
VSQLVGEASTLMTTAPAETGGVPLPFTSGSSSSLMVSLSPMPLSLP